MFTILNPKSEGNVHIQNNNVFRIPKVNQNVYQNPEDFINMKAIVTTYVKNLLVELALIDSPFFRPLAEDPINAVIISDYDDIVVEQYVKNNTNLDYEFHHYTSHCKMATRKNGGVVNGNTRVYGTNNVYIADNSICPLIPNTSVTASAMMIGLKSSEILSKIL